MHVYVCVCVCVSGGGGGVAERQMLGLMLSIHPVFVRVSWADKQLAA